ncbi:MAG TPA: 50S ribosomal protein L11 methyltransferase [Bacillota bacterium]|nr:50S ribosomal protein L11 methyltransferase [Bacillota bacterium]
MSWIEFQIHTTNEAIEPITHLLTEHGIDGVEIDDGWTFSEDDPVYIDALSWMVPVGHTDPHHPTVIKAYLAYNEQTESHIETLKQEVFKLKEFGIDLGACTFTTTEIHEQDWATAWEKYYKPVHVTETLTVAPTWENYEAKHGEIVIELDPGMAFGTGTHETTNLCMKALQKYITPNDVVIDVGCGSGILSITSVKLGAKHVYAYDLDEVAVKSTLENTAINNCEDTITVKRQDLLTNVHHQVDVVVSNILAEVIMKVTPNVKKVLKTSGIFIASGIIDSKLEDVINILQENGFTIVEIQYDGHWVSIVSKVA